MTNVLSIDLEDWNEVAYRRATGETPPLSNSLERQIERLLGLLQESNTQATFFVLGSTAEKHPVAIRQVSAAGHEIASHGHAHLMVYRLTPAQFAEDTRRGKQTVEDLIGKQIRGYRAAEFSINRESLWALESLAEIGFEYDSSIFPIRHRRYGVADFWPRPARYHLRNGLCIAELPLASYRLLGKSWPVAGGGYFRLLPEFALKQVFRRMNRQQQAVITYLHPCEFDPQRLRIFETARPSDAAARWRARGFGMHQNIMRRSIPRKVRTMLKEFRFGTCAELLTGADLGERRELFPAKS